MHRNRQMCSRSTLVICFNCAFEIIIYKVEKRNVIMLLQRICDLGLPRSLKFSFFLISIFDKGEFEDTKGIIRNRISKKEQTMNAKNDKSTNNYLQNTSQKSKDVLYETRY